VIIGEKVRLRAIDRKDLPQFVKWLNDPDVRRGLMHFQPFSVDDEEEWYEGMRKSPLEEHPLTIEIKVEDQWEPIGNCGLFGINWRIRSAEFGIFIGVKDQWDKGFGTEALRLSVRHGFETLNLNRICLRVYADNPRAIRSYEKAGLTVEGSLRQGHYHGGEYIDVVLMSILRSEWNG
jgi:RimJ/RimL family protein N-acetyltransferase